MLRCEICVRREYVVKADFTEVAQQLQEPQSMESKTPASSLA